MREKQWSLLSWKKRTICIWRTWDSKSPQPKENLLFSSVGSDRHRRYKKNSHVDIFQRKLFLVRGHSSLKQSNQICYLTYPIHSDFFRKIPWIFLHTTGQNNRHFGFPSLPKKRLNPKIQVMFQFPFWLYDSQWWKPASKSYTLGCQQHKRVIGSYCDGLLFFTSLFCSCHLQEG